MDTIERRIPWEYAQARESRDIVRLRERYGLFIGGEFVGPRTDRWFTTIDPSTAVSLAELLATSDVPPAS